MKDQNHANGADQHKTPEPVQDIEQELLNGHTSTQNPLDKLFGFWGDLSRRFSRNHISSHAEAKRGDPKTRNLSLSRKRKARKRRRKISQVSRKRNR